MWYYRRLPGGLVVMQTRHEHAEQLEELQRICFPTLADAERFKAVHYRKHVDLFEDGQFVVLDGDRVVGATSTIRLHFDFQHIDHTFSDIIQGGWLTSHQPDGDWLYGADMGVAPAYRGRGLGTALYAARQEAVWRFGLQGQVTAGMIRDYGAVRDRISAQDYYRGVIEGRIKDATLSMQLAVGFEPRALLANYLNDPSSDNYSVLLVLDAGKTWQAPHANWPCRTFGCIPKFPDRGRGTCSPAVPPPRLPASAGPPTLSSTARMAV